MPEITPEQITIKKLNHCTFDQALELWNSGFSEYYSDMTQTPERFFRYMGAQGIQPQLSPTAFAGDEPAGFVLIAVKEAYGERWAWNGGTGVNPKYRGQGIAKRLMKEAVAAIRGEGIGTALLEVVSKNAHAIAAYESAGFRIAEDLIGMKRNGPFEHVPFARRNKGEYTARYGSPADAGRLPFYRRRSAWTCQWFNLPAGQSITVYDSEGRTAGYALFQRKYNDQGEAVSIVLHQCEAAPDREDASGVIRFALAQVFGPADLPVLRQTDNLRATNPHAVEALREAGFETSYEQKLMLLEP